MTNKFNEYLQKNKEYGVVDQVKYPIVECSGLPDSKTDDMVLFETGELGQIMSMSQDKVEVVTFTKGNVKPGTKLVRTGEQISVEVGDKYLGKVIDPLGNVLFSDLVNEKFLNAKGEKRNIDNSPKNIASRKKITRQLLSGLTMIDVMLPLAKGQRELVVGDRQTGKTWTLMNLIRMQTETGAVVVYAIIGKEKTEISRLKEFMAKNGLLDKVIIVATGANDSPSLISLTPYVAMTHAEYFRDQGTDVLILMDDLTTHAMYYREMSLLAKRFPGRDSYPGDIFFKHARLLERAGNFYIGENNEKESAITALAVAGTINNTLTSHIVSNLIGITDGHLLFDADLFNRGRRPSINLFLSVTRVGKQTQTKAMKTLGREVMMELAKYEEVLEFSHFGAELSDEKKALLKRGEKMYKFFEQSYTIVVPTSLQVVLLAMIHNMMFENVVIDQVIEYRRNAVNAYNEDPKVKEKIDELAGAQKLEDLNENLKREEKFLLSICQPK